MTNSSIFPAKRNEFPVIVTSVSLRERERERERERTLFATEIRTKIIQYNVLDRDVTGNRQLTFGGDPEHDARTGIFIRNFRHCGIREKTIILRDHLLLQRFFLVSECF